MSKLNIQRSRIQAFTCLAKFFTTFHIKLNNQFDLLFLTLSEDSLCSKFVSKYVDVEEKQAPHQGSDGSSTNDFYVPKETLNDGKVTMKFHTILAYGRVMKYHF